MAKESWAKKPPARPGRGARWLSRAVWTLALLALLAWFGWLLIRPFWHPRTHLVLLTGDVVSVDASPAAIPADYVVEDFRELVKLESVLHQGLLDEPAQPLVLGSLSSPDQMQQLADLLNTRVTGRGDVILIYVSAHGLTQDGDAWLLASGTDPQAPLGGRYRLTSLLAQLRECEARAKVLLLEAGRIDFDPLRGLVDNDFPCRLAEQVRELGDPSLWVLVSHGAGQRSHLSPGLRQSVFGHYVASGLAGAADANADREIDLAELNDFVTRGVSGWIRQTTGGASQQTPVLLWGGGDVPTRGLPTLAAVRKGPAPKSADSAAIANGQPGRPAAEGQPPGAAAEIQTRTQQEIDSLISRSVMRRAPQGQVGQYANETVQKWLAQAREGTAQLTGGGEEKEEQKNLGGEASPQPPDAKTETKKSDEGDKGKAEQSQPPVEDRAKAKENEKKAKSEPAVEKPKEGKEKAEPPPAEPQPTAPPPPPPVTPDERAAIAAQLQRGWQLRDELAASNRPTARPVDYAPQLWRQLEARLLVLDRRFRTGFLVKAADLSSPLADTVKQLEAISALAPPADLPTDSLAARINAARPARALGAVEAHSLAQAELIAREGGAPLAAELAPLVVQLDRVITAGSRTDLEQFAKSLKPEHDRYLELRIARRLAERSELDFRLVQLLLESTRASGRAAALALGGPDWVRGAMDQADAQRLAAERQLLTAAARTDRDAIIAALSSALEAYQTAIADLESIRTAQRLAADVWHALPHYLAWQAGGAVSRAQLNALLDQLTALEGALAAPALGKAGAVRDAAQAVAATRRGIEHDLDPTNVEQLVAPPAAPGEAWRMQLLLETPLPSAPVRAAITALLPQIDRALADAVEPPNEPLSPTTLDERLRRDQERFFARADLQQRLWAAAMSGVQSPDRDALEAALSPAATATSSLADRRGNAETALADLVLHLPARVERGVSLDEDLSAPASRPARVGRLRAWQRASRLVDPRSTLATNGSDPSVLLANAAAYDLLTWLRGRARRAAEDAPPQEASYQLQLAAAYRAAAASIPLQPPLDLGATSPVEIIGPDQVALTYEAERTLDLAIRNTTAVPQKVWLTGQWERELVALGGGGAQSIYSWAELGGDTQPTAEQLAKVRPSLELAPNQTFRLPLTITRRQPSLYASHLVLRVLTEKHTARHDLSIALPPPEDIQLLVAGPPGRWTPGVAGLTLHPFPNRTNSFVLRLASGKPQDRKVDVEVLPLLSAPPHELPAGSLSANDAKLLRDELTVGLPVADAKTALLPGNGAAVSLTLVGPKVEAPPPPAPAPAAPGAPKAAAPKSDKPPPTPLAHGLLIVVTDQADQRQTFKWVQIAPQRPQRYLRPQVRYRAGRERIEIKLTAVDPALLPADGVKVQGDILEPLPADSERQLDAVLNPGDAEAEMHVEVPAAAGRVVTLRLTVDGYPRAIYFRVPCSGETSDVSEDLDTLAARIVELPKGDVYKPPVAAIPVRIEIDAPASVLKNPPLRLEAGIDRNRDRELRGDETVVLATDRQVTAALVEVEKNGGLAIEARVGDFTLELPAASLAGGRANVLVRAILGDREAWSEPVEIVIDGQPPKSSTLELRPGATTIIGQDLIVSALCDDFGLSGVAKMEAAFDLERSGKFGGLAVPLPGALGDDGRWSAKLPTAGMAGGAYNVLVRAIDRAENVGEPIRASVRLLTQAQAEAKTKRDNSADITGVVAYGDQPQAGVTVALRVDTGAPPPPPAKGKGKTEPPPPLATATTDAQGRFKFAKIAPGKYLVAAESLVKNKNRRAEQPLAFQAPAEVQPVTLKLK